MKIQPRIQHFASWDRISDLGSGLPLGFDFPCTETGEILHDRLSPTDRQALAVCLRSPNYEGPFVVGLYLPVGDPQCV